jgi:hypothetical protein
MGADPLQYIGVCYWEQIHHVGVPCSKSTNETDLKHLWEHTEFQGID